MNSIFRRKYLSLAACFASAVSTPTFAADVRSHLFVPAEGAAIGSYQDETIKNFKRDLVFTPWNEAVEAAIEEIHRDPNYIFTLYEKVHPMVSKATTMYHLAPNLEKIKKHAQELAEAFPSALQDGEWGRLVNAEKIPAGNKSIANAAVAYRDLEKLRDKVQAEKEIGSRTTLDAIRSTIKASKVYYSNSATALMKTPANLEATQAIAVSGDIVMGMIEAAKRHKKIFAVVAADKENVGGSPFDGVNGTVEETLCYCAPQLALKLTLAAIGRAYPNPGVIVVPDVEFTRKLNKINRANRNEFGTLETLEKSFHASLIFAPAYDLRTPMKATIDANKEKMKADNKEAIKQSAEYKAAENDEARAKILNDQFNLYMKKDFFPALDKANLKLREEWLSVLENKAQYESDLDARIDGFFAKAEEVGAESLVFPGWGTGVFLNPLKSVYAAMKRRIDKGSSIKEVIFVTFDKAQEDTFGEIFDVKNN